MITEHAIREDLDRWFSNPASVVPAGDTFQGVIVFERRTPVTRGPKRLGVAAGETLKRWWDREGTLLTMPFTSQPSEAWSKARAVGFATTRDEAVALLFPQGA
jgi:hypothetical protein